MTREKRRPLGYVEIPGGKVAIFPTNHIFLTYTFDKQEYWEALRLIVNVFVAEYKKRAPASQLKLLTGKIKVETEYKHLFSEDIRRTKEQDIRMFNENLDVTYVEYQNEVPSYRVVEERSTDYYAHGIIKSRGKTANQVWILAETVESVSKGAGIKRYVLKDEIGDDLHPNVSGIMYVDLKKLTRKNSPAGELASFLLGHRREPKHSIVRKIVRMIKKGFKQFQKDKEVSKMLTARQKAIEEGEARGEARGKVIGEARGKAIKAEEISNKLKELQQLGLDANEILRALAEAFSAPSKPVNV